VLLAVCGGPSPGILFIDDVHWADASSLDLLAYLVRRPRPGRRLCVVLTWRDEQVPPDHHLRGLLTEAQRARLATVLHLSRLDRVAVEELVESVVGDADGLGRRLYDETEGLPLFLGEYLAAITNGALSAEDETWSQPGGVRDLLHGRLEAVGETGWQLLNTAAVIGRSFDFDTVREASGRSEEEAVVALEELTRRPAWRGGVSCTGAWPRRSPAARTGAARRVRWPPRSHATTSWPAGTQRQQITSE
jgi:predicted ATPase